MQVQGLAGKAGFGLTLCFFLTQAFAALGFVRKRLPGGFRPLATLPHVGQCCGLPLGPRLLGTGEEEVEVRAPNPGTAHAHCSLWLLA